MRIISSYIKLFFFFGITCLLSCNQVKEKQSNTANNSNSYSMQKKTIKTEEIKKMSVTQANAAYGEPFETDRFNMKGGVVEFRMELYELFDENEDVDLFEATWSKDEDTNITVWYKESNNEWLPVHTMEWEKGLEF